jgi:hypothetical protein
MTSLAMKLSPNDDPPDSSGSTPPLFGRFPADSEDLPYKVEIWDEAAETITQVVAVTASPAIGYAAFYAATREYPGRAITLRHDGRVISRWTARTH